MSNICPVFVENCPCKDCKDRHVNCHSNCPGYADYRKRLEKKTEEIRFQNSLDLPSESYKKSMARCRRRKWGV